MALSSQKDLFDLPASVTYLNCAYMGPLSHSTIEAGRCGVERKGRPWEITSRDFFEPVEEARALFAQVIGGDADGVALIPSVSYGISTVAQNIRPHAGARIVLLADEFPSNVYPWRGLAEGTGAELVTVRRPDDHDWTRALTEAIDERVTVVSVPQCHWTDGSTVDLVAVGRRAREAGAVLVVDGSQSVGALPMDVGSVKPDVVVAPNYKWLLGPYSTAFMWVAPAHREGRPLEWGWTAKDRSDEFARLVDYTDVYRPGARRYDVGEVSNFALLPAVLAALRQTLQWGVDRIAAYTARLTDAIERGTADLGLAPIPRERRGSHLIGVRLGAVGAEAIASAMASAEVYVSVRGDAIRVSPHVYNDAADVERFLDVLASALRSARSPD